MPPLTASDPRIEVRVTRRVRQSIGLRLHDWGVELIAHPSVPVSLLREVLDKRHAWILDGWLARQVRRAEAAAMPDSVCWEGVRLPVVLSPGRRLRAWRDGEVVRVSGCGDDIGLMRRALAACLRREATLVFADRLARLAPLAARPPVRLSLSSARGRWGSCSSAGHVRLNWRLVQAPLAVLDYVIAHELAHLKHMNHSAAFWAETARLFPDWKPASRWLKEHGSSLFGLDDNQE